MKALTLEPSVVDSARLEEVPEPNSSDGSVLVDVIGIGVCGTDIEIVHGDYGWAPPGQRRLVLGHESIGRVVSAPSDSGLVVDDLVVAMVRHPDPVPCRSCAVGDWDLCRNGGYTEHGIKAEHGFARERYRAWPDRLVKVDPALGDLGVLLEPTSVVAKAWEIIDRVSGHGSPVPASGRALITGAGPIGLLAALLGRQRNLEVHVLDRVTDGPKPGLVADLGATYHSTPVTDLGLTFDVVVECTGVSQVIVDAMGVLATDGVCCLTGVSSGGHSISVDIGELNRSLVLDNGIIVGSVNANRRHYEAAAAALAAADQSWLARLVSRRVPMGSWADALNRGPNDVKVMLTFD